MKNKIQVALLHFGGDQIRGTEKCLLASQSALIDAGFKVKVFCNDINLYKLIVAQGNNAIRFNFPEIMFEGSYRSFPIIKYLVALWILYKQLKGTDLIYCSAGLPCQLAVPVSWFRRIPVLCHFHHPAPKRYFYLWLVRFVDQLIFPSQFTKELVNVKCGRSGDIILNAVNLFNKYTPARITNKKYRGMHGINHDEIVYCQIGALVNHKNIDILIKAFSKTHETYPNTKLLIIGEGPEKDKLHQQIIDYGLNSSVHLLGYVPSVLPYLQHVIDVNVLASSEEGFGITIIEAAGCSIPSIVTNCTGMKEVVVDEETGYLFADKNIKELIVAMGKYADNKLLCKHMGFNARNLALERYSENKYREKIIYKVNEMVQ